MFGSARKTRVKRFLLTPARLERTMYLEPKSLPARKTDSAMLVLTGIESRVLSQKLAVIRPAAGFSLTGVVKYDNMAI
ncbi:MAG: hypothetical protein JWO19_5829 [Bryobacterales bacterium]|nr:hypothetical protein [Bryobacterales bacterium]